MKKVLALVLAVMMLATVAFATDNYDGAVKGENNVKYEGDVHPGDEIYVWRGMDSGTPAWVGGSLVVGGDGALEIDADVNSKNYTKTTPKFDAGRDLFGGIEFNDKKNELVITVKEDYTLKKPQRLAFSFALKGKGSGSVTNKRPKTINIEVDVTVSNNLSEIPLVKDNDLELVTPTHVPDDTIEKFTTENYGSVVLACADDGDTEVSFRAYKNDELFLFNDTKANATLLKAYADEDAEISFLKFPSNQVLNSTATIRFYKEEDSHVYVMKDGKLTSEVKWDEDEECFILKTRTLGSYVFSDKALPFNVSTPSNPDTGANDVVGIASALAAVALVSAAAVSLKK